MAAVIRPEVTKIQGYHLETPPYRIKLNQNESPYDLPAELKETVLEKVRAMSWNRYPTPWCDDLQKKIGEREGWDPRGVLVAGGSNILIQAVGIAAGIGRTILTVEPSFSLYEIEGAILGARVVKVPLAPNDFSLPVDTFLKKMRATRPAIVFLANPNAPTGNLFPEEAILEILKKAPGLVVVDEAYHQFAGVSLKGHLKRFPNLVLLRTFSKAFSLGGVRIGYLMAAPQLAQQIRKVTLAFSVGFFARAVAEVVLEESGFVDRIVTEIVREREIVTQGLMQHAVLRVHPSRANFVCFQTRKATAIFQYLLNEGILIRNVTAKLLPNALRVTIGSPPENQAFLKILSKTA